MINLMLELPVTNLIPAGLGPLVGSLMISFLVVSVASAQPGDRLRTGKAEEVGMSAARLQQASRILEEETKSGRVLCWGDNGEGRLGIGRPTRSGLARPVAGLP